MEQRARIYDDEQVARCLFREANDAYFLFDLNDDSVLDANPAAQRLTGFESKVLRAMHVSELLPGADPAAWPQLLEALHRTTFFHSRDGYTLLRRSGTPLPVNISVSRIHAGPSPLGLLIARDVSERLRADEERRRLAEQLQETQRLESLGVLASGAAQVFSDHLTSIRGHAWLAELALPSGSPVRKDLEMIIAEAEKAADLCKQMQACTAGGPVGVRSVDMNELLNEMRVLLQTAMIGRGEFNYELAPALPGIQADPVRLRRAILNIVTNAAESLPEAGGLVRLTTAVVGVDEAYLRQTDPAEKLPDGNYVRLEIADNGCGMDPSVKARIFEPFFTTKVSGRGVGLSAVYGIVRSHGGAVWASSRIAGGTTITMLLPVPQTS
jgi:two-component system cell cycle sensor histidine kinase/response regulator CckA